MSSPDIPVIDITALRSGKRAAIESAAAQMLAAAEHLGFFYISGHGVDSAVLAAAEREARAFFALSLEKKLEVEINHRHRGFLRVGESTMHGARLPDLKESFIWGLEIDPADPGIAADNTFLGENNWPADRPAMRTALNAYFEAANGVGIHMLRAFAVAMGIDSESFVQGFDRPISRGSAIYYPPQPAASADEQYGVSPHTDFGCMTLLYQDLVVDSSKLRATGWTPRHASFETGWREVLRWYQAERWVPRYAD